MRMPGHENAARREAEKRLDERTAMRKMPTNGERELHLDYLGTLQKLDRVRIPSGQNPDGSFQFLVGYDGPVN